MWEIFFAILAGIFVLIVLAGFFIPSKISFSRTMSIDADKKIIYAFLNDLYKWRLWSAWSPENDAAISFTYDGEEKGKGAVMKWKGKKMGSGRMEIKESEAFHHIQVEIVFNNSGFRMQSYFELTPSKDTTHVAWKMEGKIRRFGIAKIIGLLLPGWMGKDMQTGLKILRMLCESPKPNKGTY